MIVQYKWKIGSVMIFKISKIFQIFFVLKVKENRFLLKKVELFEEKMLDLFDSWGDVF